MKTILMMSLVIMASSAFAGDGALGSCHKEAQQAVIAIAKINKIKMKTAEEYNKLLVEPVNGEDFGQVVDWKSADDRFTLTTNQRSGEKSCIVESLSFNPEP